MHMNVESWDHALKSGETIPDRELVRYSPFSRQTIHNYTIMGLIREAEWTQGGHRLYDESVFDRLSRILELKKTKSLTEIRRILTNEEKASPSSVEDPRNTLGSPLALEDSGHTDVDRTAHEERQC
jgi:DNA-binding transcriptional MerR regulator